MGRWQSLRWRLPWAVSLVTVSAIAVLVFVAYREVESALTSSAAQRAQGAAGQVAAVLDGSLRASAAQVRATANLPAIRRYLLSPTDENREAMRAALQPLQSPLNWRVLSIWDAAGRQHAEIAIPAAREQAVPALPPARRPTDDGLRPLQPIGDASFIEFVVTIAGEGPPRPPLGFVVTRSAYTVAPPGLFARLVGDNSVVMLGNRDGDFWIDLATSRQSALPADAIGGEATVGDTPMRVFAAFPRRAILAPARRFLQRMTLLALVVVTIAALTVRHLTRRVSGPLAKLTAATESVAAGDYSRPVAVSGHDELTRLGRAFDTMRQRVAGDLAERAEAARALQDNEERLRYTLSAARVGTWENDLASGEMRWSDTMGALFGVPPDALPSGREQLRRFIHPDDRDAVDAWLRRDTGDSREHEITFRALQPDGTQKWINGRSRVTDGAGRNRLVGVCIDVTEQKLLEEQLRQSQKMEAIGKLAGGVAHDFNNMLTAILGFGTFLFDDMAADDPRRKQMEEILKAGRRAADLTSQLLAFSRQQLLQPVIVDVNAAINDTAVMLRRLIGEHVQLATTLAPQRATVRADPVQLQQILMNLSINARDAMPKGGRLTIEVSTVELDESYGNQHFQVKAGPYVLIAVMDTGVGMTEEVRARLFEPFFTTKQRGEGTGLGLATVYGAVKQAGGYIWAYGEPGKGSTFKVYLPRVDAGAGQAQASAPAAAVASGKELILLVEDEAAVRMLTKMILERAGYRVIEAVDAEEAEATHRASAASIDMLLTDVVLPGSSGSELYQRLSRVNPQLKVVYMSGYTDDTVFRTGRLERGVAFVQKPFTAEALTRRIRETLDN